MLIVMDGTTKVAVMELHKGGLSVRAIAVRLGLSRSAVQRVVGGTGRVAESIAPADLAVERDGDRLNYLHIHRLRSPLGRWCLTGFVGPMVTAELAVMPGAWRRSVACWVG